MNKQLQKVARDSLKTDLAKCTEAEQLLFKRMYSHKSLGASINDAVDGMDESRLDYAMEQVRRTLEKRA